MASNLFSRHNSLVVPELLLVSLIRNTCITGPLLSSLRVKTTHPTIFKHFLSAVLDEVTYQILRHEIIVSQSHRALYVSFGCRTCCWLWMLCVCLRVTSTWAYKPSVILKKSRSLGAHTTTHTKPGAQNDQWPILLSWCFGQQLLRPDFFDAESLMSDEFRL